MSSSWKIPSETDSIHINACGGQSPETKGFFDGGGSIEIVTDRLFRITADADELAGNGWYIHHFADEIRQLPSCRDDREFAFVRSRCGYTPASQVG